jgi:uncharacterized protein (DUF433 family)/transposase-like protein
MLLLIDKTWYNHMYYMAHLFVLEGSRGEGANMERAEIKEFYGGKDPRDIPAYTIAEVAHLAGVSESGLSYWIKTKTRPLILRPDPESSLLSFTNALEAFRLALLRRRYRVPLRKIRPALQFFASDEIIEDYLQRVELDEEGKAYRLYPLAHRLKDLQLAEISQQPKIIMVDPLISFGRPSLVGSGIPTSVIAGFFQAGDSIETLAKEYGRKPGEIEEAIRFERLAA